MSISTITISGNDYTSYASVAEAAIRLAVDPVRSATWTALTSTQMGIYLVAATNRLDLLNWAGEKTGGASQVNQWPRTGVTYADGTDVSTTEVPTEVENATILLAGSIAIDSTVTDYDTTGGNIKRTKAGSAEVEFFRREAGYPLQDKTAYQLIKDFLEGATISSSTGTLASGTDGVSTFDVDDPWGLSRGFA
jgi:Putative DnaT-like ssDNA binding protein